jgi:hypothetical protein
MKNKAYILTFIIVLLAFTASACSLFAKPAPPPPLMVVVDRTHRTRLQSRLLNNRHLNNQRLNSHPVTRLRSVSDRC